MEKIKRNGRMSIMTHALLRAPNRIITLNHFCNMFDAAKSTISEDIELLRGVFDQFGVGAIETVTGAAGGVRFLPGAKREAALAKVEEACTRLSDPSRLLPGGFLYMTDLLSDPAQIDELATILSGAFLQKNPDFVLTIEMRGIGLGMAVARALGVPLVVARRDHRTYEGPQVSINYQSGSTGVMQTMSLPKRAAKEGQRALIVDDFMRAGGSIKGMMELMHEFSVKVVGAGVLLQQQSERPARVATVLPLMVTGELEQGRVEVKPAAWLHKED